uniref:Uncharacterized protein n=1 Tax=Caulobacter phage BL57 TaxID=3348355 RepID=A0AB74UIH9_9VIRU
MRTLTACRLLATSAAFVLGFVTNIVAEARLEAYYAQNRPDLPLSQMFHDSSLQGLEIGLCVGALSWALMYGVVETINSRRTRR